MQHPIYFELTIILVVVLFVIKKPLHLMANWFLFIILQLFITGYISVLYINLNIWTINKQLQFFIMFRIYEIVILPILFLLIINILAKAKTNIQKVISISLFLIVTYCVEYTLVKWNVITYNNWNFWQSILIYLALLLVISLLRIAYYKVLLKEGIIS